MLHVIIKTVTYCTALSWLRAPKRFNLLLSEKFCLSQRMQESIDPKALITYIGSTFHGPSGPGQRLFIAEHGHFQISMASMQNWQEVRRYRYNVISQLFVVPKPHTLIPDHSFHCIDATCNNHNDHILLCPELISGRKAIQFVTFWEFLSLSLTENAAEHRSKGTDHIYRVHISWSEWSWTNIVHIRTWSLSTWNG